MKKTRVPGFSSKKKKKNPGYQDSQGNFFGRYAPDQNTDLRPNGGGADGVLGGGEVDVVFILILVLEQCLPLLDFPKMIWPFVFFFKCLVYENF